MCKGDTTTSAAVAHGFSVESFLSKSPPGVPDTPMEEVAESLRAALSSDDISVMKSHISEALRVVAGLDPYMAAMSTPPSKAVSDLVQKSEQHDWDGAYANKKTQFKLKREMCAGSLEGAFVRMLAAVTHARDVLEIGMFTATTTLAIAEVMPPDGHITALEMEPYLVETFAKPAFASVGREHMLDVKLGPAMEGLKALANEHAQFDLIFIDADKPGYESYLDTILESNMLAPQGMVVADNTLFKSKTYPLEANYGGMDENTRAMHTFNRRVLNDSTLEVVMLPLRDGVSLIRRKAPSELPSNLQLTGAHVDTTDDVFRGVPRTPEAQAIQTTPVPCLLDRLRLRGQVAMVTGGGQGIGRAFAHALAEAGARVSVVDIDQSKANAVASELVAKGAKAIALAADVSSEKDCHRMVDETVAQLGGLNIACNNAGINRNSAAEETAMTDWDDTFNINTRGVFMGCQAQAKYMFANGGGRIVNTASMATLLVPHPQKQAAYNCSKAAVVKMTETLACEWADRNVQVNCISPGIVNTALIRESPALAPLVNQWLDQIPMGRLAEVADLQLAFLLLCSQHANPYMTGHNLVVEGAQSLW